MPHLLIVDDNADHLFLTRRVLRSAAIDTTAVQTAEAALEAIQSQEFDMILLDHNLPGMKGAELIARIRAMSIETPVVMVTGGGSEQLAVDALKAGALDYIIKNDGYLATLAPRIQKAIAQHQLEMATRKLEREREAAVAQAREHARRLRSLQQASLRLNSSLQPRDVRSQAVNQAASLLDTDMAAFFLLSEDGLTLRIAASSGLSASYTDSTSIPVGEGTIGVAVLQGEPVAVSDTEADERFAAYAGLARREGYRAVLSVPLLMRGDAQGGLSVLDREPHKWEQEEIAILQTLAQNVAVAYENAQLLDRLASRVTELQTLNRIVTSMTTLPDLEQALDEAVIQLCQLLDAVSGAMLIIDSTGSHARLAGSSGLTEPLRKVIAEMYNLPQGALYASQTAVISRSAYGTELVFVPDVFTNEATEGIRPLARALGFSSIVKAPLIPRDEPIGALHLFFEKRPHLDRQERQFLETAANAIAMAVQRSLLQENLLKEEAERLALAESGRLKTEFISTVSHELRTPLTSIEGYVQVILNGHCGDVPEVQKEFLQIVSRNSKRLCNLVDDLLDISRIESGTLLLERQPADVAAVLSECASMISGQAAEHNMPILIDAEPGLPLVNADPQRLGEVITNLLSNAIKYGRQDTPVEVAIRCVEGEDKHEWVQVNVQDHGAGIPQDEQPRLFTKFYRIDNSSTRTAGGTGLGLAICKHLVELHGGKIWVESEPGKGSTFSFMVPAIPGGDYA
jgi:signal transduction histidine kinase/DNA-binding response OmpR family regulator